MIFKKSKHQVDLNNGVEIDESTEIWVADFGSHELETELRQEVAKLKPKEEPVFSWAILSVILFIFVLITELLLRQIGLNMYWSEKVIYWATWIWRLVLITVWLALARFKWLLSAEKMFVSSILAFLAAVLVSGIIKIIHVKSAWAWLNLLVEPFWTIIIIFVLGMLFLKMFKNNKQ